MRNNRHCKSHLVINEKVNKQLNLCRTKDPYLNDYEIYFNVCHMFATLITQIIEMGQFEYVNHDDLIGKLKVNIFLLQYFIVIQCSTRVDIFKGSTIIKE